MNRKNGFTLIEMLIAIVVLTVILALGVPSFMEFIKNNRVTAQANSLVLAIQMARSEAVKRVSATVVCSANADYSGCANSTTWTSGWLVFTDLDQDADLTEAEACTTEDDFDTRDCILRIREALDKSTLIADKTYLQFLPNGLSGNGTIDFTLKPAENCEHKQQREISVTLQGHPTTSQVTCS